MFVQVIQGYVDDAAPLAEAMQTWVRELSPGATGWLGSTGGVTDDGRFIALARFESAEAARANSERPEQGAWWAQTASLFSKEVTFADCVDPFVDVRGNPDDAGFVQVMQGRGTDPQRARQLMEQSASAWAEFRPDILGQVEVDQPDGLWTMAIYFTSEAAARAGEGRELPAALQAEMAELNAMSVGMPEFFDLRDPWLYSAS
ncbi:hypothetical protein acdb102_47280 [Acidothermaceae bacterium B102]|nr:hypothetical protein acdb102_47280 [Acidothermaceae bacterium B102]